MKSCVATEDDKRCWGFSKDHRRCRLVRRVGHRTCSVHKHYFQGWEYNHPPFISMTYDQLQKQEYRIIREYRTVLENRFIDVEKYVENIPDGRLYNDFYLWVLSFTSVDSRVNLHQFQGTIKLYVDDCYLLNSSVYMSDQVAQSTDLNRIYRSIGLLCTNVMQIKLSFLYCIEHYLLKVYRLFTFPFFASQANIEYAKQWLSVCLDWPPFRSLLFSDFPRICFVLLKDKYPSSYQAWIIDELIRPTVEQQTLVWKSLCQSECYVFKEELMMKQWHPDRVLKLIEEGWEDICD